MNNNDTNNLNQNPTPTEAQTTTPVESNTASDIVSTQVQGTQTVVEDVNSTVQTIDIPSTIEPEVKQDSGVASGNTEILDISSITSNLHDNNTINIVETSTIKGASGSSVIGSIDGDSVTTTNNPLPANIDLSKPNVDNTKEKTKKVKVITKKDRIISILVTIFVIVVLIGAGYSAYYFGYATNPNLFTVKTVSIELGDELPSSVKYYVDSPVELDDMEYSVNVSSVSHDIVGTYEYTVTHGNVTKKGQIIIKDTKAPVLTLKTADKLIFMKGDKITKDKLVEKCEDISNCEYKLENEIDTSSPGEKTVNVIATDEKKNQQSYPVTVKVVDIQRTIACESTPLPSEDAAYTTTTLIELSFDKNDELVLTRKYKNSVYTDYSAYFRDFNKYGEDETYIFDKASFTCKVEDKSEEVINATSFDDVTNYYADKGYTCR